MGALRRPAPQPCHPSDVRASGVLDLTDRQRTVLVRKVGFLRPIQQMVARGVSRRTACERVLGQLRRHELGPDYHALALSVGPRGQKLPAVSTVMRWLAEAEGNDPTALAPKHTGRRHVPEGWEAAAERLYARMQQPSMYSVYEELAENFPALSYAKVRRHLGQLPAQRGAQGPARVGRHYHAQSRANYRERDLSTIRPGEVWQGDGHRVDVYLAHPATGHIWRPELTVWLDVASRYVTGWYIAEHESTVTTHFALCHALQSCNHLPLFLHVDNGSGFAARTMRDEHIGLYRQLDVEPIFAIPGNPKAKGHVERFFLTLEGKYGKRWDTYCGPDMAPEANRRLAAEVKAGRRTLPSLAQYAEGLRAWIDWYHQRPHRGLDGRTPAQVWAERTPNPVPELAEIHLRERAVCKVARQRIRLHNRVYRDPLLAEVEGREVIVEYWLHDDQTVRVLDMRQRHLCAATLVRKDPYLPASRMEERRQKNLAAQRKRAQLRLDEVDARARGVLPEPHTSRALEALGALEAEPSPTELAAEPHLVLDPAWNGDAEPEGSRLDITDWPQGPSPQPRQRLDVTDFD